MGTRIRQKSYLASTVIQIMMIFLVLFSIYPLFFMIITALKSKEEYIVNRFGFPGRIAWNNFIEVLVGKNFTRWFLNSVILTVGGITVSLVISLFAAYALSRYEFRIRDGILKFIISLMMIPPVIMIIPLFVFMSRVNLTNSYIGTIIIYSGLVIPFSIFLLTTFFKSIPLSIIESAYIDGCSAVRILTNIMIPLSLPSIVTLIVINALWIWNELFVVLIFLQQDKLKTLMVGITVFKSRYNVNVPLTMVGLFIVTIPMIIIYFIGQKYFTRGLISGSMKE